MVKSNGMDWNFDVTNVRIETDRLVLRSWAASDIDDLYEYASVDGVGEMAGWKHHESKAESRQVLRMFLEEKNVFALVHKENGRVIGSLTLHGSWAHRKEQYAALKIAEIGYVLSRDYWGRGLIAEAVKAVIDYCFNRLDYDALTICHFLSNTQSERVIQKCGFQFVAIDKYESKQLNITYDEKQYILFNPKK